MEFEWDETKRLTNIEKHGVDFAEAIEMFTDSDKARATRAYEAVMKMVKIDLAAMRRAFDGVEAKIA